MFGSATSWLQRDLLGLHGPVVYIVVALLVFVEVGIVIGFFIPGEIATIVGGVIASQHRVNVVVMIAVVALAASLGNLSGYSIGKTIGPWLVSHRPLRGHTAVLRTERLIARRGGIAVLIGRWIVVVRAVMPGLAGMSEMTRTTFLVYSVIGGIGWAAMWVLVGFAAGLSYTKVLNTAGTWSLVVLGVVVAGVAAYAVWRTAREHQSR